ncbi:cupin domain-containing protein [Cohnella endophytica]|uniref:Cupin domain-containing protein n=1 Tax=Cohnella endophytica TaxID=2419778 RepID=A0A494XW91_9BACL|nr:sugar phosphate nucleotidyltransferase [Cohnella endophytica]RKP53246.1 cupin domain-containing protein [Cohnella endophytica]
MKLVLLSGGSGKRLWPLSNDRRSKQFLKVLMNEDGEMESMVQRVWRQLKEAGLQETSYLVTGASQLEILQSQLEDRERIIVEPERRDTFPAIALAATYLYSIEGVSLDEVVGLLPVDPYVEASFFDKIRELESTIEQTGADIALIGVKPLHPSEKYGYIVPEEQEENAEAHMKVKFFKEKPSESLAQSLIQQNALWNCGVFAFKLGYIIELLIGNGYPIQYEEMKKQYRKLPQISFDYEVIEKADQVVVNTYYGYWKDLGTWNTLTEEMSTTTLGNVLLSEDCINTHVINEYDVPVTVIGLSDIIVAASPDGILVADKQLSPKIKDLLKDNVQRPMYEERQWGSYRVLDFKQTGEGHETLTKRISLSAGKSLDYEMHLLREEIIMIVSGTGEFTINGTTKPVKIGDVLSISAGNEHSLATKSGLEYIEVQIGDQLLEDDKISLINPFLRRSK